MLVDSHCHLNYLDEPAARLADARARGVSCLLCIGVDAAHIHEVLELAATEPDVWATVGQHPEVAHESLDWIEPLLAQPRVVAVGETGLDYHHDETPAARQRQRESFEFQLRLAEQYRLPVVVHTRSAQEDTLALLRDFPEVTGVLHCFTESWDMAAAALEIGYFVSISGIVTFRNGDNVREVAKRLPLDRLLLETDAPWLAPVPNRGKQNQPAYVRDTAEYVAGLRGTSYEELVEATARNFHALFTRVADQNSSS